MQFDGVDIGGPEVGSAHIEITGPRLFGDRCIGAARVLLGTLKQRMGVNLEIRVGSDQRQLAKESYITTLFDAWGEGAVQLNQEIDIKDAITTDIKVTYQSRIAVTSIKGLDGQADIDTIKIHTDASFKVVKKEEEAGSRCLGYIVQFFMDGWAEGNYITVTLPSKKQLTTNLDTFDTSASLWDTIYYAGYGDNGAAYIPIGAEHQVIALADSLYTSTTEGLGPVTPGVTPYTAPTLPAQNSWVMDYDASGTCGSKFGNPVLWHVNATGRTGSFLCTCIDTTTPYPYELITLPGGTATAPTSAYTGDWELVGAGVFWFCHPASENVQGLYNYESVGPILVQAAGAASATGYATLLAKPFFADTTEHIYNIWNSATSEPMFRREDGHGFAGGFGLKLKPGGIEFTEQHVGNGERFAVMVPSDKARKYSLAPEWRDDVDQTIEGQTPFTDVGKAGCSIFNIHSVAPGQVNVIKHYSSRTLSVSNFGVPVNVESGIHKVNVDSSGEYKIHLLMEGAVYNGYTTVNITNIEPSDTLLINVGALETSLSPSSLVSVQRG